MTPGSLLFPGRPEEVEAAVRNLEADTREHRKEQRRLRLIDRFRPLPAGVTIERLEQIAQCESGGDPRAVSSTGLYHGKYQFHPGTWRSVGGKGLPSEAPEVEQDYRAGLLLARSGPGQWPVCGA
ncbi:MAG: transglycosylase family protein [Solirubrobacterales bacterium]